jgi:hypothetical protein
MKYDQFGVMENTFFNWLEIVAYVWLFVSIVAGIISVASYLYSHLQWI